MLRVYGLKNCDTCKKALKWLEAEGIRYEFQDFRKDGLDEADLDRWLDVPGHEALVNKRGATWRALSDEVKAGLDRESARALILKNPALIKRPLFEAEDMGAFVGFASKQQDQLKS